MSVLGIDPKKISTKLINETFDEARVLCHWRTKSDAIECVSSITRIGLMYLKKQGRHTEFFVPPVPYGTRTSIIVHSLFTGVVVENTTEPTPIICSSFIGTGLR